jgi:hypothetical protein
MPKTRPLAQLLVIVDVFVAQRQPVNPLRQHLFNRVLDQILVPAVRKTLRQTRQQVQTLVGLAKKKRPAIGTDRSTIETGHDFPPARRFKA